MPEDRSPKDIGAPEPPWWRPRRASSRPQLTRDAIIDAALRVLDREGLDRLSMRRVAEELSTGAATLYWHVTDKEQLLNLVLDRVIGEVPLPQPDPARWKEQIRSFAREGRAVFRRYRDVARASMGRVPFGPNLVRVVEWELGLLRAAGVPARSAAWFGDLLALYVAAHALEEDVGTGEHAPPEDSMQMMQDYFRSLPPDRFPELLAAGPDLFAGSADERFEFGLDVILRGLESHLQERET